MRISDVAIRAGVSPGTASKALNGTGQLRAETRDRVHRAAAELGFRPHGLARALSLGRSFTVGLLTTDSFGRFSLPVMLGVEDAMGAGEMAVLLCDTRDDPLRERHYLRTLVARQVDGLILTGRRTEPRVPVEVPNSLPVVYVFRPCADPAATSIVVDDAGGARLAAEHVLGLGRRRVAVITGPPSHLAARTRADAVVATLSGQGLAPAGPVQFGEWSERWGRLAATSLIRRGEEVDAILCGSDQIARGACDGLREADLRVPDDVAVVGFDNWDVMALACRPPLTTVDLELQQLGRQAAALLLDAIAGEVRPGRHQIAPRLVIRESSVGA
ncbi:LacI family DNA-binding transcriptional regulator [Microlunatus ginsengisoli]|uniref:LacI family DNA-binding transcriptional regulator n=1 Tax=Microlunatus ginsengisoli TaxID=363863 RepID=A0ABP6ZZF9_9ACTN